MWSQTFSDNGDMNDHKLGGSLFGFAYKMLMPVNVRNSTMNILSVFQFFLFVPSVMNGIVKSTAVRLA